MNRAQAGILLVLLLLACVPLAGGTDADVPKSRSAVSDTTAASGTTVEADSVEFRITVFENASARWTFTYTRILENETQQERFRAFTREFDQNETDAFREFREQARALAANGRNVTDRDMRAEDFAASAELGGACVTTRDCGTIRMSFTWEGFADQRGDELVVGDVFGSGLFLSENQQIVFEAGPGLEFASASPEDFTPSRTNLADSTSITYEGMQTFSDRRPRVALTSDGGSAITDPGGTDSTTTTVGPDGNSDPDEERGLPLALIGGLIVVLLGAGAAIVWWRGEGAAVLPFGPGGDGSDAAMVGADDVTEDPSVPDEELLTDEDRVLKLLRDNGGRMKQVDIVAETGWSKSKVSMLLSDMEDEEHISKLRVGRENIISLVGHEPEAAGSPHEED